jgi:hypothetical protein
MADKIYFVYERLEPFKYPEPRDIRNQLEKKFRYKYKDKPLSSITLSTEVILKSLKLKDEIEKPLLKYRIVNLDWEDTKKIKDITFENKMFRWQKAEETFDEMPSYD